MYHWHSTPRVQNTPISLRSARGAVRHPDKSERQLAHTARLLQNMLRKPLQSDIS